MSNFICVSGNERINLDHVTEFETWNSTRIRFFMSDHSYVDWTFPSSDDRVAMLSHLDANYVTEITLP